MDLAALAGEEDRRARLREKPDALRARRSEFLAGLPARVAQIVAKFSIVAHGTEESRGSRRAFFFMGRVEEVEGFPKWTFVKPEGQLSSEIRSTAASITEACVG